MINHSVDFPKSRFHAMKTNWCVQINMHGDRSPGKLAVSIAVLTFCKRKEICSEKLQEAHTCDTDVLLTVPLLFGVTP